MNILPAFLFEYAIRFPDGQYYLGPTIHYASYPSGKRKYSHTTHDPLARGPVSHAYTYTESAAYGVLDKNKPAFDGCVVVKIP